MATPNIDSIIAWVMSEYPGLPRVQTTNCRRIAGSSAWSQHSWANAADIFGPTKVLDEMAPRLRERFRPMIKTLLWRVPDHFDHIHVDTWPTGTGIPPCAGGILSVRHRNGTTGTTFTADDQGDDAMEFIIRVLKGQNMAFYRALKAKTGAPGGNADYWGSDYTGQKPSDEEWQEAADILLGAALQTGVFGKAAAGTVDNTARAGVAAINQRLTKVKEAL